VSKKQKDKTTNQPSGAPAEGQAQNVVPPQAEPAQAVDQVLEGEKPTTEQAPEPVEPGEVEAALEQLRRQCEEAKDRALRYQAELDNYRKRVARQMEQERRYACLPLLRDLLPVWDNMERALEAAQKNHEAASLLEGFKMVIRQLEDVFRKHHCTPIEALGQPFDPHRHEAICQQPSDEHPANTVLQVTRTGFQLHDRVVRPSQVIVSTRPEPKKAGAAQEPSAQNQEGDDAGKPAAEGETPQV